MPDKVLVVHSGTFKTGSSSIQLFLSRAEHGGTLPPGVHFPKLGRQTTGVQHQNLVAQLAGFAAFTPSVGTWEDLVETIRAADSGTWVLSSENFSLLSGEQIARIGDYAREAGAQVRWVHYVRDQATFYNAFYVERLMVMRPEFLDVIDKPFEEFRDWSPLDMSFLWFSRFAQSVVDAIPGVDLRLRPFSRAHLVGGDAVADFMDTAGIELDASDAAATNIGNGWQTVETAKRLTPLVRDANLRARLKGAENPAALRMRWIQLVRRELLEETTALGWNSSSAVYLTPDFRDRLRAEYHDDNVRIGELGGFPFADIVEADPGPAYNIGDYDSIPASELMAVMHRVLPWLLETPAEITQKIAAHQASQASPAPTPKRGLFRRS